jgi:Bcr/CflA subfamily drug resistance transporter
MNRHEETKIVILANVLAVLGWLSINIYLPSLPLLEKTFAQHPGEVKLSITLFLAGFALSQFFWGSISERFGRKNPILFGLLVAAIGSVLAMCAPNVIVFDAGRLIEGTGIGAASVLARALLTDSFNRTKISYAMSYITTSANIMPALAPIVGGFILLWFGWRFIFLFLIFYTMALFVLLARKLPETHKRIKKDFTLLKAIEEYFQLFKHREFLGYLLPYVMLSGGMLGFYTATPFIFINVLGMSAHLYAFFCIATVASYIVGVQVGQRLIIHKSFKDVIFIGVILSLIAACGLILCSVFGSLNVYTILLPMMIYTFAAGMVAPNANAGAMAIVSHIAGASGAVIGASLYAASAILSYMITSANLHKLGSLAFYISGITLIVLFGFYFLILRFPEQQTHH